MVLKTNREKRLTHAKIQLYAEMISKHWKTHTKTVKLITPSAMQIWVLKELKPKGSTTLKTKI